MEGLVILYGGIGVCILGAAMIVRWALGISDGLRLLRQIAHSTDQLDKRLRDLSHRLDQRFPVEEE